MGCTIYHMYKYYLIGSDFNINSVPLVLQWNNPEYQFQYSYAPWYVTGFNNGCKCPSFSVSSGTSLLINLDSLTSGFILIFEHMTLRMTSHYLTDEPYSAFVKS